MHNKKEGVVVLKNEYIFGVDIGGTAVKLGLVSAKGELCEKWEIPTRVSKGKDAVIADIAASLRDTIENKGLDRAVIRGVGVGVPGPVDGNGVVHGCVNLGWGDVEIESELGNLCELTVKAQNDANVAALGELWKGAASGCESMVLITLGTGVGGAVVLNGNVILGAHGCGGELGHINVCPDETKPCSCGRRGCLEQYASATGLVRTAKELLKSAKITQLNAKYLTAEGIFEAAEKDDAVALLAIERMTEKLGRALADITVVCDPQRIVIGGGVSKAGEPLRAAVERNYRRFAFGDMVSTPVMIAKLQNDAGILGAASLLL